MRRSVLVHRLHGLPTIGGVLDRDADDGIELVRPTLYLEDGSAPQPLGAPYLIPWSVIEGVQDVSATVGDVRRDQQRRVGPPVRAVGTPQGFAAAPADPRPRAASG